MSLGIPKLYADDNHSHWVLEQPHGVHGLGVFDDVYRYPRDFGHIPLGFQPQWTIGDAISLATGYSVMREKALSYERRDAWWSAVAHSLEGPMEDHLRPAYVSQYTEWYYHRDVISVLLPRQTCGVCSGKFPRDQWKLTDEEWRRCQGLTPDWAWQQSELYYLFQEYRNVPTCSGACRVVAAEHHRHMVDHLREVSEWVRKGRKSLRAVRTALRQRQNPGA